MPKKASQPTSSDAANTTPQSPGPLYKVFLETNWGAGNNSSKKSGENDYFASSKPKDQITAEDLKLLAEMMRGRQRLP
jgi:hypothetical protein